MTRISSNWTIFLKLFIPTFWIVFFGAFCIAVLLSKPGDILLFSKTASKLLLLGGYFVFLGFLYLTVMRLHRVDYDDNSVYITNYFKTYRYPLQDLESIQLENYTLFKLIKLKFKGKTKFGTKIYCLPSKPGIESLQSDGLLVIRP